MDAQHGCHFADDNELEQSFRNVLVIRGGTEFYVGMQRLIQSQQSVLKTMKALRKNSLIIATDVHSSM
jgi:hypothetical protein